MTPGPLRIGCAGWAIPRAHAAMFPGEGTQLERYARVLDASEINSSFHRSHSRATYERWARSVPDRFRFSVKMPKEITHVRRLAGAEEVLARFLAEAAGLGEKLAVILVQLPPSLRFESDRVRAFLGALRARHDGTVVCEPRHPDWFTPAADRLLAEEGVSRVAADPPPAAGADRPGGWSGCTYFRLHGSPRRYYSAYSAEWLGPLARQLGRYRRRGPVWVIFDNTAAGAAIDNALTLRRLLR